MPSIIRDIIEWMPVLFCLGVFGAAIYGVVVFIQRHTGSVSRNRDARPDTQCPVCGCALRRVGQACHECGWDSAIRGVKGPRQIAIRQLRDLRRQGAIDDGTLQTLIAHLSAPAPRPADAKPTTVSSSAKSAPAADEASPTVGAGEILLAQVVDEPPMPPAPTPKERRPDSQPGQPPHRDKLAGAPKPISEPPGPSRPSPLPVSRRVEQYAARREKAAVEQARVAAAPRPPRQAWGQVLSAFMEQKHIRWGELVGGLLIVSCSVALVISFWEEIAQRTWLKFGVFNGVTAALFGAGLHAARRWKLPTTSEGLLIIATLLVPLNFLAIAAFSADAQEVSAFALGAEVVSLAFFAALVFLAGRVILPGAARALTAVVMGQCVLQLLIRRLVGPETPETGITVLYVLGTVCLLAYCAVNLWGVRDLLCGDVALSDKRANGVFKLLGISSFATLLPAGMLILKTEDPSVIRQLSPLAVLAAIPAFASGLPLWSRSGRKQGLSGIQVAGSSLVVGGAMLLAAGMMLAWPQPHTLIPTAALSFLALTLLAFLFAIPEAHLAAAFCLSVAYVLSFHLLTGRISGQVASGREIVQVALDAATGNALVGLVAVFAAAVGGCAVRNRPRDAAYLSVAAGLVAIASLGLVTAYGFGQAGDPHNATWVYAIYTTMAMVAVIATRHVAAAWTCAGLLFLTIAQAVVFRFADAWTLGHWIVALLLHATVTIGLAGLGRYVWPRLRVTLRARDTYPLWADAWCAVGLLDTLLVVCLLIGQVPALNSDLSSVHLTWLGAAWLALSILHVSPALFAAFQVAIALALMVAVNQRMAQHDWYATTKPGWLHPASLQIQGIALSLLGILWSTLRLSLRAWGVDRTREADEAWQWVAAKLLYPAWPSCDQVVTAGLVVLMAWLAVYGVVPGVAQELSPQVIAATDTVGRSIPPASDFELLGWPHRDALGRGSWVLLAALAVLLIVGLREDFNLWCLAGVAVTFSAACLLLAGRWDSDVAVASALRWYTALLFFLGSVVVWVRRPLLRGLRAMGWPPPRTAIRKLAYATMVLLLFLAVAPLVAMAAFVGLAAVNLSPPDSQQMIFLQWLVGLFVICGIVAIVGRNLETATRRGSGMLRQSSNVLLVLGVAPLVAMTLFVVAVALSHHPIVGPEPTSFFTQIGLAVSYALPMLVIALALLGHAVDQRSAPLALAAGLLLNLCATAAYLLETRGAGLLGLEQWVRLAQLNACVASVFGSGWIWFVQRDRLSPSGEAAKGLVLTQVGIALGFAILAVFPAVAVLFWEPQSGFRFEVCAGLWGWTTVGLATVAAVNLIRLGAKLDWVSVVPLVMITAATLIAFESHRWDIGDWETYHAMLLAYLLAGFGVLAVGGVASSIGSSTRLDTRWVVGVVLVSSLFAFRSVVGDPTYPWWTAGGMVGVGALSTGLAAAAGRRRYLYFAGLMLNLATSIWWLDEGHKLLATSRGMGRFFDFLSVNVIAMALPVALWLAMDRRFISRQSQRAAVLRLGFHRFAATFALLLLMFVVALSLIADSASNASGASSMVTWLAWSATAVAVGLCLWDVEARFVMMTLYLTGLTAVALVIDQFDLPPRQMLWTGTMGLAAYGLGTSYLASRRRGLMTLASALRVPSPAKSRAGLEWLIPVNLLLTLAVVLLGFWSQFVLVDWQMRLSASQAIIAQALAVGMLARGRRETQLRFVALWLGVLGTIAFGWSFLRPESTALFLNRAVVVSVALAGMSVLYGLGLSKLLRRENEWTRAAARMVPTLAAFTLSAIAVVLTAEVLLYVDRGIADMSWPARAAVAIALTGLAVACLVAAVVPGRDPLGLSERQRQAYVYASEALLALLFLHIRLTMPWLFRGFFLRYWPMVVMAIAFFGVGLSEWFQRRRQHVLAQPLERTGVLLPLLPVLGFWVAPKSEVNFSILMLVVGVLYGSLSVMRRSFGFGVLAALAVNSGLWYLLHQTEGLGLLDHPQLWLIPPALCVLIAAYMNRERLNADQMTTIRYSTSAVIYSASTADIFLNGVAQAPWLPVVLAGLSILGILAGMALRVRAFLFLGTSFLLISLMTMVWYAAVDLHQTWLWFVSGIVAGIVIIAVFALFEKKREDVLQVVERLKDWDA